MKKPFTILAIETSCDETGIALVEASGGLRTINGELVEPPRLKVIKNLISSQIKIHRPFGGVVPDLTKREHMRNLPLLFKKLTADFSKSKIKYQKSKLQVKNNKLSIDLIAVTVGPGLEPALWTGINFAQDLHQNLTAKSYKLKPKLIGVNHMEGHLYSFLLSKSHSNVLENIRMKNIFPAVASIVSGGHTILLLLESLTKWKKLGETRDDAAGEAFDKVARLLGLPYPGGPEIEKLSARGDPEAINLPRPMIHQKNYDFSFSGLKTSVLYYLRDAKGSRIHSNETNKLSRHSLGFALSPRRLADVAASFQQAAVDVLVHKTMRAARECQAKSVILCGGVAANKLLRKALSQESKKAGARFLAPDSPYNTDNAAMVAAAGYINYLQNRTHPLAAQGNLDIEKQKGV